MSGNLAKNAKVFVYTAIAATMGTATCSLGAYVAEQSAKETGFDQTTFLGRYKYRLSSGDPGTLLHSNETVLGYAKDLEHFNDEKNKADKTIPTMYGDISEEKVKEMKKIVQATIHPDTGAVVPHPFRMSGYVPFNGPICAAMMLNTSTIGLLFWNWVNQSHNALVNYFNRNASSSTTTEVLLASYAGAVGSAMSVAFILSKVIKNQALMKFIAFPASMVASSLNCYIMRRPEIGSGIDILDEEGESVIPEGVDLKSSAAAKKAVYETVASRSMLQVPVFLGPALILSMPPIVRMITKFPLLNVPTMTFVTMACFGLGLPATVAIFPQQGTIKKEALEPAIQQYVQGDFAYYNKGL